MPKMSKSDLLRAMLGGGGADEDDHEHEIPVFDRIEQYGYHEKLEGGEMLEWVQKLDAIRDTLHDLEAKLRLTRAEGAALYERIQYETRKRYDSVVQGTCTAVGIRKYGAAWYVVGHVFHQGPEGPVEKHKDGTARPLGGVFL